MAFFWNRFGWPSLDFFLSDCDIVFKPHFLGAPAGKKPLVLTVYDLSFFHHPDWFTAEDQKVMMASFQKNLQLAKLVLAISQSTKDDLIKYFKVDPEKIVVTLLGADDIFKLKAPSRPLKIQKPYILYLGTLEPRKNILGIIKAFSQISADYPELKLVLAGRQGWLYEEILKAAKKLGNKIILTGPVADEERLSLYKNSEMFVYPSFFEGFGLPVLEAMQSGTAVITSNTSSLPEVAGDAAILVDPKDTKQIAMAMKKILDHSDFRQKMRQKGRTQAAKFSWDKCAQETLKAFEKVKYSRKER